MLFTIIASQTESVPVGTYPGKFSGFGEIETSKGKALRWEFTCGKDGRKISGLSDANSPPTTKNKTGRWLAAISGQGLTAGAQVDPMNYIGRDFLVIVGPGDNGSTRLETFSALPV